MDDDVLDLFKDLSAALESQSSLNGTVREFLDLHTAELSLLRADNMRLWADIAELRDMIHSTERIAAMRLRIVAGQTGDDHHAA